MQQLLGGDLKMGQQIWKIKGYFSASSPNLSIFRNVPWTHTRMHAGLLGVPSITERTLCDCPLLSCVLIGSLPIVPSNCISQIEPVRRLANNQFYRHTKFKAHKSSFSIFLFFKKQHGEMSCNSHPTLFYLYFYKIQLWKLLFSWSHHLMEWRLKKLWIIKQGELWGWSGWVGIRQRGERERERGLDKNRSTSAVTHGSRTDSLIEEEHSSVCDCVCVCAH